MKTQMNVHTIRPLTVGDEIVCRYDNDRWDWEVVEILKTGTRFESSVVIVELKLISVDWYESSSK